MLSLTESTWLSGPASDGRRQCLVNGSSAWLRSRAYIYCSSEENCKSEQLLCRRMDGRTDERTKGFSRKALVEIGSQLCCSSFCRCPQTTSSVYTVGPLVKRPLFPTSKTSQDATTSCKADAREAITSSCDKMSRDAVRDRTVEQYDYRRTMALRTMALRTTWCKGSFKKRRPVEWRLALQGRLMMTLAA